MRCAGYIGPHPGGSGSIPGTGKSVKNVICTKMSSAIFIVTF